MNIYKVIGKKVLREIKIEHIAADGVPTMKLGTYKIIRDCANEEHANELAAQLNDGSIKEEEISVGV